MTTANLIIIAGGGIGGLTAAISLQRRGLDVLVLERAPELREAGAGITVQTNAMLVMEALGLSERLTAEGHVLEEGAVTDANGRVLQEMELADALADIGPPGVAIHRQRLLRALADAYQGPLRLGAAVTGFEQSEEGVRVALADGEVIEGAALVGCDGLHSAVRRGLRGEEPLRYAGYTTWRGIARDVAVESLGTTEIWGAGDRFGIVPIGQGEVYWFAVAACPEGGADGPDVLDELRRRFDGWPDDVGVVLAATVDVLRSDTHDRPPIERWGEGRMTLLGDAAHPMTPNLGQGAGQAIEDAWALACSLTEHSSDIAAGLRAYEDVRRDRANWFVKQSYRMGSMAQLENPLARMLRNTVLKLTPASLTANEMRRMYTPVPDPR